MQDMNANATTLRGYANPTVVQQANRLIEQIEDREELVQALGRLFWAAFDVDALRNRVAELEGR